MGLVRGGFAVIREHKREFIAVNIGFYGLFVGAMCVPVVFPQLQQDVLRQMVESGESGIGAMVDDAYLSGNVPAAAALTFLVNLFIGMVLVVTAPSLLIPFFGIGFTIYRVILWGLGFSPVGFEAEAFVPHLPTLIVEGQAGVIAALAVWIHGRMFLWPRRSGLPSRWAGYREGVVATLRLYPLVVVLLVVAACYEAIEVIYFIP